MLIDQFLIYTLWCTCDILFLEDKILFLKTRTSFFFVLLFLVEWQTPVLFLVEWPWPPIRAYICFRWIQQPSERNSNSETIRLYSRQWVSDNYYLLFRGQSSSLSPIRALADHLEIASKACSTWLWVQSQWLNSWGSALVLSLLFRQTNTNTGCFWVCSSH